LVEEAFQSLAERSNLTERQKYALFAKKFQPIFESINGVAKVDLISGEEREIQISEDEQELEVYGPSIGQVQQVVVQSNLDFSTGNVSTRDSRTTIRLAGKVTDVEELRNLPITTPTGVTIFLRDVADVQDGIKEIEKIARLDQQN